MEKFDFAAALAELGRIAEKMESQDTPVDDMKGLMDRARDIYDGCGKYLSGLREDLQA